MGIHESIKSRRIQMGLTQQDLADYADVSLRMVVSFENGKGNPSLSAISRMADVLGMDVTLKVKEIEV